MFRRQFHINSVPAQQLSPVTPGKRFEGLGYSSSGAVLAAATADTNATLLYRREPNGKFQDQPFCTLEGLKYPHDVSFAGCGGMQDMLAIAQREGAVSIFAWDPADSRYGSVCEISGPQSKLEFSDGVAFVPPRNDYIAACNLNFGTITFYACVSQSPVRFSTTPEFELKQSLQQPDGLAFSDCGTWLAVANHGGPSVSLFRRQNRFASDGKPVYGPEPVAVLQDVDFRHPHSVAFTAAGHLVVTNAGANYLNVYRITERWLSSKPSLRAVTKLTTNDENIFRSVNTSNKMEGGPKGVAIHGNELAVCSPEMGIRIYAFRER